MAVFAQQKSVCCCGLIIDTKKAPLILRGAFLFFDIFTS
jgi:hypothetical protein